MPIYEYTCAACGKSAEILQKLSDPPAKKCPACGKPKLSKQISAAGFRLSGGGWYETDFKKDGQRNLAGDKAEAASSSTVATGDKAVAKADAKSSAKSDTAPKATKSEAKASSKPAAKDGKAGKKKAASGD